METKEKNGTAVITDQAGMPNNVIQWATMPYRFEYRRGGYSSFWAWYAALRSALSFLALSRFLIRAKALSIMAVAFSLVAPAKLSHTAVRCASSAVKVDDNLSFWSQSVPPLPPFGCLCLVAQQSALSVGDRFSCIFRAW